MQKGSTSLISWAGLVLPFTLDKPFTFWTKGKNSYFLSIKWYKSKCGQLSFILLHDAPQAFLADLQPPASISTSISALGSPLLNKKYVCPWEPLDCKGLFHLHKDTLPEHRAPTYGGNAWGQKHELGCHPLSSLLKSSGVVCEHARLSRSIHLITHLQNIYMTLKNKSPLFKTLFHGGFQWVGSDVHIPHLYSQTHLCAGRKWL